MVVSLLWFNRGFALVLTALREMVFWIEGKQLPTCGSWLLKNMLNGGFKHFLCEENMRTRTHTHTQILGLIFLRFCMDVWHLLATMGSKKSPWVKGIPGTPNSGTKNPILSRICRSLGIAFVPLVVPGVPLPHPTAATLRDETVLKNAVSRKYLNSTHTLFV